MITTSDLSQLLRRAVYIKSISGGIDKELREKSQKVITELGNRYKLIQSRKEPELLTPDKFLKQKDLAYECVIDETKPLDELSIYWQVEVLLHRNLGILAGAVDDLIEKTSEIKVHLLRTTSAGPI